MIIPSYEIHVETRMCSLSFHDPLVEPLLSHSVRPTFFCIQMSSCLLLGEPFGRLDLIQSRMWMTGITHLLLGDLTSFDFFGLSYVRCHTGAYLVSDKIYRSSWIARSSPLMRYTSRQRPIRYFIMILQWSPQ